MKIILVSYGLILLFMEKIFKTLVNVCLISSITYKIVAYNNRTISNNVILKTLTL